MPMLARTRFRFSGQLRVDVAQDITFDLVSVDRLLPGERHPDLFQIVIEMPLRVG